MCGGALGVAFSVCASCRVCVCSSWAGSNWGNKDLADLDFGDGDEDSSDSGEDS